jgi:hypothetical protein
MRVWLTATAIWQDLVDDHCKMARLRAVRLSAERRVRLLDRTVAHYRANVLSLSSHACAFG